MEFTKEAEILLALDGYSKDVWSEENRCRHSDHASRCSGHVEVYVSNLLKVYYLVCTEHIPQYNPSLEKYE